jgi:hypothetical protein
MKKEFKLHPDSEKYIDIMIAELKRTNMDLMALTNKMKVSNADLEALIIEEKIDNELGFINEEYCYGNTDEGL